MVTETRVESSFVVWIRGMLGKHSHRLKAYTLPAWVRELPCGCARTQEEISQIRIADGRHASGVFRATRWRLNRNGSSYHCERCGNVVFNESADCQLSGADAE